VPDDFSTIQEALDAANPGDTVYVRAGTYTENVQITKSIYLIGENCTNTTIDGGGVNYPTVRVNNADNIEISGFAIQNGDTGICLNGSAASTISGNLITNNAFDGIRLENSSNCVVSGNRVTNSTYGIHLVFSSYNTFRCNAISDNSWNLAVFGGGVYISYYIQDIDISNTVDGKPIYYWVNKYGLTVPYDAGHISLVNCTGITAENLNLTNNFEGIFLIQTTNSTIKNNILTSNMFGVFLDNSSYNTIYGNTIVENDVSGIALHEADDNKFYHNNIIGNPTQVINYDSASTNIWDDGYPSGGNYWSDYTGTDADGDGIGNTSYVIDAENEDRYPLMEPWTKVTWEYIFEDEERGATLKISTDDNHFRFISPDKEFSVKEVDIMSVGKHSVFIWHKDEEIQLLTLAVDTRIDYCFAYAKDMQTGNRYLLIDKLGIEN
jgi:parallel beta-helix repeat protein